MLAVFTVSLNATAVPPSGPATSPVVTPPSSLPIDRIARLESNAAAAAAKISALETKLGNLETKIGTLEKLVSVKLNASCSSKC